MSSTERVMNTTADNVGAVLTDGWNYADWVVGAVHIRSVDAAWPSIGSRIHHRVGAWPLIINDATEVVSYKPNHHLELQARMWPLGEARINVSWTPIGPDSCRVRMDEQFVNGPALALRNFLADALLHQRNKESLERLESLTQKYSDK